MQTRMRCAPGKDWGTTISHSGCFYNVVASISQLHSLSSLSSLEPYEIWVIILVLDIRKIKQKEIK